MPADEPSHRGKRPTYERDSVGEGGAIQVSRGVLGRLGKYSEPVRVPKCRWRLDAAGAEPPAYAEAPTHAWAPSAFDEHRRRLTGCLVCPNDPPGHTQCCRHHGERNYGFMYPVDVNKRAAAFERRKPPEVTRSTLVARDVPAAFHARLKRFAAPIR